MLCILKYKDGRIVGWLIASDIPSARRQADNIGERDLAASLYRMEFNRSAGVYYRLEGGSYQLDKSDRDEVPEIENGYLMLVS